MREKQTIDFNTSACSALVAALMARVARRVATASDTGIFMKAVKSLQIVVENFYEEEFQLSKVRA